MATWKKLIVSGSNLSDLNNNAGYLTTGSIAVLTDGNGIVDFTYDVTSSATISVEADSTTGGNVVPVNVSANGVGLAVNTIVGTGLSADGSGNLNVQYGSSTGTAVQGNTTITINGTSNEVEITGTNSQALGGAPSYTIGLPNNVTIGNNLTVSNDLIVLGTASFQNSENLLIADRFALFASGSTTTGDGGIVVQQSTQNIGEALAWDSGTSRWGVTGSFAANTSTFVPDAYLSLAIAGAGTNPDASPSRYDAKGNIFIGTDEEIWIYA